MHCVHKKQMKSAGFVYKQVNTETILTKEYSNALDLSLLNISVIAYDFGNGDKLWRFSFLLIL